MAVDYEDALDYSSRWIDLIQKNEFPTQEQAYQIIDESKNNFAEYYNRNWLEYRKSVTESGDWASVEWTGSGAVIKDVLGREFLDFLGGVCVMDLWCWRPDGVSTLKRELWGSPKTSQELIYTLRCGLCEL